VLMTAVMSAVGLAAYSVVFDETSDLPALLRDRQHSARTRASLHQLWPTPLMMSGGGHRAFVEVTVKQGKADRWGSRKVGSSWKTKGMRWCPCCRCGSSGRTRKHAVPRKRLCGCPLPIANDTRPPDARRRAGSWSIATMQGNTSILRNHGSPCQQRDKAENAQSEASVEGKTDDDSTRMGM
jgi:hypothetical protein